jgi:hypothetical protein
VLSVPLALGSRVPSRDNRPLDFFENLLPEGPAKLATASMAGVPSAAPFGLVAEFGGDCTGAVVVLEDVATFIARVEHCVYVEVYNLIATVALEPRRLLDLYLTAAERERDENPLTASWLSAAPRQRGAGPRAIAKAVADVFIRARHLSAGECSAFAAELVMALRPEPAERAQTCRHRRLRSGVERAAWGSGGGPPARL